MVRPSDSMLVAYVDGELDAAEAHAVERLLQTDPDAADKVRIYRDTAMLLRAACGEPAQGDMPERLLRAAQAPAPKWRPRLRLALPLAASIAALAAGWAGGANFGMPGAEPHGLFSPVMLQEVAAYHLVYAAETEHLVEVRADRSDHIRAWMTRRLGRTVHIPDLSQHGWSFAGARLLALEGHPVAQLVYTKPGELPMAVCLLAVPGNEAPKMTSSEGLRLISGTSKGFGYVIVGDFQAKALEAIGSTVVQSL